MTSLSTAEREEFTLTPSWGAMLTFALGMMLTILTLFILQSIQATHARTKKTIVASSATGGNEYPIRTTTSQTQIHDFEGAGKEQFISRRFQSCGLTDCSDESKTGGGSE